MKFRGSQRTAWPGESIHVSRVTRVAPNGLNSLWIQEYFFIPIQSESFRLPIHVRPTQSGKIYLPQIYMDYCFHVTRECTQFNGSYCTEIVGIHVWSICLDNTRCSQSQRDWPLYPVYTCTFNPERNRFRSHESVYTTPTNPDQRFDPD